MFENLITYGKTHAPGIFTAVSIVTGLGTIVYSFWAGGKVKEIHDNMPEDATFVYKAGKYVPVVAPIIVGATISSLTCYSAHRIHTKRYLALAGTLALTQKDNENLRAMKDKMKERLGIEKTEEARKETAEITAINNAAMLGVTKNQRIEIYDGIRGKVLLCTPLIFWDTVSKFNERCENSQCTLVEFLENLHKAMGTEYEFCEADENIIFGLGTLAPIFNPSFDKNNARVRDDMTAIPVFMYKFATPYDCDTDKIIF